MNMRQQLEYMVRFFHPEKKYAFLRGGNSTKAHAALFGLRESFYNQLKSAFTEQARAAAKLLCQNSEYIEQIKSIRIKPNGLILALGDSLTDDSQSWFEMIKYSFETLRPADKIQFINLAVSGDTSSQMLGSIVAASDYQADLYLCLIGINDARIQGGKEYKPYNSLNEVAANFDCLITFAKNETQSPWLWITPPGVIESRIESHDFFKPIKAFWSHDYVSQIAELIIERADNSVDLRSPFSQEHEYDLFDSDGLHWSIHGQSLAAQIITEQLSQLSLSNKSCSSV
jgi:lysophospholipase L1-like esterase